MAYKQNKITPFTQTTLDWKPVPPKVTYSGEWKEKLGVGNKRKKTYTPPQYSSDESVPTYHYDKKGYVKKVDQSDGGTTKYKKGNRKYK